MEEKLNELMEDPSFQEAFPRQLLPRKLPRSLHSTEFRSLRKSLSQRLRRRKEN